MPNEESGHAKRDFRRLQQGFAFPDPMSAKDQGIRIGLPDQQIGDFCALTLHGALESLPYPFTIGQAGSAIGQTGIAIGQAGSASLPPLK